MKNQHKKINREKKVTRLYDDKFNNKRAFITLWRSCLNQT